jgi:hypothetical protein
MVAECLGDDRGWGLQDELAKCRDPCGDVDAHVADQGAQCVGVERLSGAPAGEEPSGGGVGGLGSLVIGVILVQISRRA